MYADIGHLTDDSYAWCLRLLDETGVATAPGIDFDTRRGNEFVRFSFAGSADGDHRRARPPGELGQRRL